MKYLTKISIITLSIIAVSLLFGFLFFGADKAIGGYTETQVGDMGLNGEFRRYEFFASSTDSTVVATTTNATSTSIVTYTDDSGRRDNGSLVLKGADTATFYFTRNGAVDSTATSTFEIEVSPDGTKWIDYNKLISNVTNTNTEDLTRVSSIEIVGATSTTMVSMDLQHDAFQAVRCIATIEGSETDDSNECQAVVNY